METNTNTKYLIFVLASGMKKIIEKNIKGIRNRLILVSLMPIGKNKRNNPKR
jgi:hypothetical protein